MSPARPGRESANSHQRRTGCGRTAGRRSRTRRPRPPGSRPTRGRRRPPRAPPGRRTTGCRTGRHDRLCGLCGRRRGRAGRLGGRGATTGGRTVTARAACHSRRSSARLVGGRRLSVLRMSNRYRTASEPCKKTSSCNRCSMRSAESISIEAMPHRIARRQPRLPSKWD